MALFTDSLLRLYTQFLLNQGHCCRRRKLMLCDWVSCYDEPTNMHYYRVSPREKILKDLISGVVLYLEWL